MGQIFAEYGPVNAITVREKTESRHGRCKSWALVTFSDPSGVTAVTQIAGMKVPTSIPTEFGGIERCTLAVRRVELEKELSKPDTGTLELVWRKHENDMEKLTCGQRARSNSSSSRSSRSSSSSNSSSRGSSSEGSSSTSKDGDSSGGSDTSSSDKSSTDESNPACSIASRKKNYGKFLGAGNQRAAVTTESRTDEKVKATPLLLAHAATDCCRERTQALGRTPVPQHSGTKQLKSPLSSSSSDSIHDENDKDSTSSETQSD